MQPGASVHLAEIDPDDRSAFDGGKREAKDRFGDLVDELDDLQQRLYAESKQRLLVVLQARDAGGKDGTIRDVFGDLNPQGVKVTSFKKPTPAELARDYLWRVHEHVPADGEIAVFNRSHYEDVLVVRVHDLVPEERWRKRYEHITAFEKMLADEGTTIVKIYLHISKDEQRERLQERIDIPRKRWKFNPDDVSKRRHWDDYDRAFEEMLERTSVPWAPWYVVPANRNWYRNLVVATILTDTLRGLDMRYPTQPLDLDGMKVE